ncbi:DUF305 domain-containing protein [Pseudarthrobacter sp. R1]|uniref:DUF305 domain-containing protein n=1 Tax=Pseudarthrobacter sp. R1 TaxID=2944934 RepID=UPI002109F336|nr:DUF305 domain-containing protein [Pseudarthrobacter sp. R1]MCQ6271875.1 DUF305 domain-containing protein [Pseudarthrobacter sp. R1]
MDIGRPTSAPEEPEARKPGTRPHRSKRLWIVFATVVVLTAGAFFAIGRLTAVPAPVQVNDAGADAGFARDMQTHHAQAVEMALLIRDKSANPEIRAIAYDIATSQQQQNGQLFAWLQDWGLRQAGTAPPRAWMGADAGAGHTMTPDAGGGMENAGGMAGMASAEQMQALRQASGAEADRLFTDMMIRHHQAGVDMAKAAVRLAETSKVRDFAARIVDAQTAEITALQELRGRL